MTHTGLQVLVVDDEKAIRRYLRSALAAQEVAVSEASSGEEALRAVATDHPDVVILEADLMKASATGVFQKRFPQIIVRISGVPAIRINNIGQEEIIVKVIDGRIMKRIEYFADIAMIRRQIGTVRIIGQDVGYRFTAFTRNL